MTKAARSLEFARASRVELEELLVKRAARAEKSAATAAQLRADLAAVQPLTDPTQVELIAQRGAAGLCDWGQLKTPSLRLDLAFRKLLLQSPEWPRVEAGGGKSVTMLTHWKSLKVASKVSFLKYMLSDARWPCFPSRDADVQTQAAGAQPALQMFRGTDVMPAHSTQ